jgi:hypothetical protein
MAGAVASGRCTAIGIGLWRRARRAGGEADAVARCPDDADDATYMYNEGHAIDQRTEFCPVDANIEITAGLVLWGQSVAGHELSLSHQNGPRAQGRCSNGPRSCISLLQLGQTSSDVPVSRRGRSR